MNYIKYESLPPTNIVGSLHVKVYVKSRRYRSFNTIIYTKESEIKCYWAYDVIFDVKDKDGNMLLPFTKKNPLYVMLIPHVNHDIFINIFPEFNNAKTFCAGYMSREEHVNYTTGIYQNMIFNNTLFEINYTDGFMYVVRKSTNFKNRLLMLEQQISSLEDS